ncbi:hypothetical protein EIP91_005856 [Steccherinum ochraceum]|uniref:DUF6533 domain-containing protein n=1 Tax=Steccherinum ochraceum TaxID=92696 RepID=A0A4R0REZ5_9APHY|nr:hypothetical protein EIP91_005856 [Steccherinum ochraceum]
MTTQQRDLNPLAYLPPEVAAQIMDIRYLTMACLAGWVWDAVIAVPDEVKMLQRSRMKGPDVVYIGSRMLEFSFLVIAATYCSGHVKNCHAIAVLQGVAASLQIMANSLLFIFRIKAVFFDHRVIRWSFYLFWIAVSASSLTAPITLHAHPLGSTGLCVNSRLDTSVGAASILVAAFDTLVFTSITAKLLSLNRFEGHTSAWRMFLTGKGLGHVSRLILQTGQLYYLITVGATIASSVAILCPSVPTPYADATIPVTGFLTNAMATRVYRQLKLGVYHDGSFSLSECMTSVKFRAPTTNDTDAHCLRCHSRSPESPASPDDLEVGRLNICLFAIFV